MVRFMAGYGIGSYMAVYYEQLYPDFNVVYSYLNASVVSVGGALSSYLGGLIADRWEKGGETRARMYVPTLGSLLGAPLIALTLLVPNFYASMAFLFLEYLVAECWFGPVMSILQSALPSNVLGVGIASFNFLATMAGSLMTYVLGVILDTYDSDTAIKFILLISIGATYIMSAAIFYAASQELPKSDCSSGWVPGNRAAERTPLLSDTEGGQRPDSPVASTNRAHAR